MKWKAYIGTILVVLGIGYVVVIYYSIQLANVNSSPKHQPKNKGSFLSSSRRRRDSKSSSSIGRTIVNRAYQKTFSVLELCPENEKLWSCMGSLRMNHSSPLETHQDHKTDLSLDNMTYDESWPWWFKTMLRDGSTRPVHGHWHTLVVREPPIEFCVIEKIATKQWRKIVCDVNGMIGQKKSVCNVIDKKTKERMIFPNTKKIVFLRDPLERFLSAFLDKCTSTNRRTESHCEPSPIFRTTLSDYNNDNRNKGKKKQKWDDSIYATNPFIGEFHGNDKALFEAYVDSLPLKWNVHFLPEALFCNGLYRTLPDYDYVGYFGPDFYNQVEEMTRKFGGSPKKSNFTQVVRTIFEIDKHRLANKAHVGVETSAAMNVLDYYTPRTVRRVLQYLSIDYVKLNCPIPTWAEEMLLQSDEDYI